MSVVLFSPTCSDLWVLCKFERERERERLKCCHSGLFFTCAFFLLPSHLQWQNQNDVNKKNHSGLEHRNAWLSSTMARKENTSTEHIQAWCNQTNSSCVALCTRETVVNNYCTVIVMFMRPKLRSSLCYFLFSSLLIEHLPCLDSIHLCDHLDIFQLCPIVFSVFPESLLSLFICVVTVCVTPVP